MGILSPPVQQDPPPVVPRSQVGREHRSSWKRKPRPYKPRFGTKAMEIIGIDGEGWGVDQYGRQTYMMIGAATESGDKTWVLYTGKPLRTKEILEWLHVLPPAHLTSFVFGYDVAHIMVDLPLAKLEQLYHRSLRGTFENSKRTHYVKWEGYWLDWIPGKQFIVRSHGKSTTIWDAYPFHQRSFLSACEESGIFSDQEIMTVREGKERRGEEVHDVETEKKYMLLECSMLARLQRHLYEQCEAADLQLHTYFGPGSIAAILLRRNKIQDARGELPPEVAELAQTAYIGGRFEQTGHGYQPRLFEPDINSAYAASTVSLPCLAHGSWSYHKEPLDDSSDVHISGSGTVFLHVRWEGGPPWGPWPVRTNDWMPHWPYRGHGWVWGTEFMAGIKMPFLYWEVDEWWQFDSECDHQPFAFVPELYEQRRLMKAAGDGREKPFKHALSSLYGKVAQSVGEAPFWSPVWAGMVTAGCRAQLLEAITPDPDAVVAVATDAILTRRPLTHLSVGEGLGQWGKSSQLDECLLVQPGFYTARQATPEPKRFGPGKSRTRGIPMRYINWDEFWRFWSNYHALLHQPQLFEGPDDIGGDVGLTVPVTVQRHIGIGLATLYHDTHRLGRWEESTYNIGFYSHKRPRMWWDSETWIGTDPDDSRMNNRGRKLKIYEAGVWTSEVRELRGQVVDQKYPEWQYDND